MLILGSHVSFGNNQLLGATKEAISYGANTFMFYTGAPTNTIRKSIIDEYTIEAYKLMKENNIALENVICHAPYIINLANRSDEDKYKFSISFLQKELKRCDLLGIKYLVLHPGSAVNISKEEGLNNIVNALNQVLENEIKCMILLETMAGKGSELGSTIDELKFIIDNVDKKDNIGICIDTCHINDAGYDLNNFDSYLEEMNQKIGLNKVKCLHINDSKNDLGTHKDRHANIGKGTIGFENISKVIYHDKLDNIPKILETPYIGNSDDDKERLYPPYKFEIAMLKEKKYNPDFLEDIRDYYKQ